MGLDGVLRAPMRHHLNLTRRGQLGPDSAAKRTAYYAAIDATKR
jgi:hypothetical protein